MRSDTTIKPFDAPIGCEAAERNRSYGAEVLSSPVNVSSYTLGQLLHPDVVAPLRSIHTIPYEEFVGSDTCTSISNEKTSPPSSSMIPTAPTFTDSQLNGMQGSDSILIVGRKEGFLDNSEQRTVVSSTVDGEISQTNVEVLQQ